jgi:hypothetical protein
METLPEEEPETVAKAATAPVIPAPTPMSPVDIRLRTIHAAVGVAKGWVTVRCTAEEGPAALAEELGIGSTTGYVGAALSPGSTNLPLSLEAGGSDPVSSSATIVDGASHTAIVFSDAEGDSALAAAVYRDSVEPPLEGMMIRFFHAVLGWGEIDVCLPAPFANEEAETLFAGVTYGGLASEGYIDLPSDTRRIQLRTASEEGYCMGPVIGAGFLRPPRGFELDSQNLTIIALGRLSGRPAVPRALLVCQDAPAESPSCFRVPMQAR